MSPISRPLLIGSYAAKLRGILPAWRCGRTADIDLVAHENTARSLAKLWGTRFHSHAPQRCYLSGRIDIDLRGNLIATVEALADAVTIEINGKPIECLLARPELIVALRAVSWDLVPAGIEKACRDLKAYAHIRPADDLIDLARAFRKPS